MTLPMIRASLRRSVASALVLLAALGCSSQPAPPAPPTSGQVAQGEPSPGGVISTPWGIAWADLGSGTDDGEARWVPPDGGVVITLASGGVSTRSVVLTGSSLVWADYGSGTG